MPGIPNGLETTTGLPMGQTEHYSVEFHHTRNNGISASPVAGPEPQNASLVRLHASIEFLTIFWSAVSVGKPPLVPSYKAFNGLNQNRLFVEGERIGIITPDIAGHIWQAAGWYRYSVPVSEDLDSAFSLSQCPWEMTADPLATWFYIPAANFLPVGIIKPYSTLPAGQVPDLDVPRLQSGIGR